MYLLLSAVTIQVRVLLRIVLCNVFAPTRNGQ